MPAVRAMFFDASALGKLYLKEEGSDAVREAFGAEPTQYTTEFCFYETLTLLKARLFNGARDVPRYLDACAHLTAWYTARSANVAEMKFTDQHSFARARAIVDATGVDLSDAFQILSVRAGFFSPLVGSSATILATADRGLARAAREVGVRRVWSVLDEPRPDFSG